MFIDTVNGWFLKSILAVASSEFVGEKTLFSLSKLNVIPIKELVFNLSAIEVKSIVTLELTIVSLWAGSIV